MSLPTTEHNPPSLIHTYTSLSLGAEINNNLSHKENVLEEEGGLRKTELLDDLQSVTSQLIKPQQGDTSIATARSQLLFWETSRQVKPVKEEQTITSFLSPLLPSNPGFSLSPWSLLF